MPRAFVTGGTGFIGSHLVEKLVKLGWDVRCLVRGTSRDRHLRDLGVELVVGDVREVGSIRTGLPGCDIIFHAAALVGEWGAPKDFRDINVGGMKNMLEAAGDAGVSRFVDISSTSVHGFEGFDRTKEIAPYAKSGVLYSDTKCEAEQLLWEYHRMGHVRATSIRPCMVWGPRDPAYFTKIIPLLQKRRVIYIGGGYQIAGLAHVGNVVDAIVRAATNDAAIGEAFIITDDCRTSQRDLMAALAGRLGVPPPQGHIPHKAAKSLAAVSEFVYRRVGAKNPPMITRMGVGCVGNSLSFDISKAKKILGYKPLLQFPNGLDEYLEWYYRERAKKT